MKHERIHCFEAARPGWTARYGPWLRDFAGLVWVIAVLLFVFVAASVR